MEEQYVCDSHDHMVHLFFIINTKYQWLVCQQYGKIPMVVPRNIGVLYIYI